MTIEPGLTHLDEAGRARMVDVGAKPETPREARAEGLIRMSAAAFAAAMAGAGHKGDFRAIAEIAGVMAAKQTAALIPLCHVLPLNFAAATVEPDPALPGFRVTTIVRAEARTGAEMEALTAAGVALLTLYDMLKALDRQMVIEGLRLLAKSGGASGDFRAVSL